MPLAFRTRRVDFDPTRGRIQEESDSVSFPTRVRRSQAVVKGWDITYNNGDHNLLRQRINIRDVRVANPPANDRVEFVVEFLLRDSSGNIDDPFSGFVEVLVIADVDSATASPAVG